jgi:hypothetical protein
VDRNADKSGSQRPAPAPGKSQERSPDEQLQELQRRADELERDLKQGSGDPADPTAETLRNVRRRLDALERDLNGPKSMGPNSPVIPTERKSR